MLQRAIGPVLRPQRLCAMTCAMTCDMTCDMTRDLTRVGVAVGVPSSGGDNGFVAGPGGRLGVEGLTMSEHTGSTEEAPDSRRIVVGYSGTEGSEPALTWAIETARRESRPLTILHCYGLAHVPALGPALPDGQSELLASVADRSPRRPQRVPSPCSDARRSPARACSTVRPGLWWRRARPPISS